MCYSYPPDQEYYKETFNSVMIIWCEINKAKDYTFTLLAKLPNAQETQLNKKCFF